jgi:hypothetical protein
VKLLSAGNVKHAITDRTDAYETFLKHLEYLSGINDADHGPLGQKSRKIFTRWLDVLDVRRRKQEDDERRRLISITLDVIDAGSLSVDQLVRVRTSKRALASELRQKYANAVEEYFKLLGESSLTPDDAESLREDFRKKMLLT